MSFPSLMVGRESTFLSTAANQVREAPRKSKVEIRNAFKKERQHFPQYCLLHYGIWPWRCHGSTVEAFLGESDQYALESGDIHGQRAVLASYQEKSEG